MLLFKGFVIIFLFVLLIFFKIFYMLNLYFVGEYTVLRGCRDFRDMDFIFLFLGSRVFLWFFFL